MEYTMPQTEANYSMHISIKNTCAQKHHSFTGTKRLEISSKENKIEQLRPQPKTSNTCSGTAQLSPKNIPSHCFHIAAHNSIRSPLLYQKPFQYLNSEVMPVPRTSRTPDVTQSYKTPVEALYWN